MMKRKNVLITLLVVIFTLATPIMSFGTTTPDKCTVYLHFNHVMTDSGFKDFDYTPQKLSYGVGWNFTKKKLDNFISCKSHFEYEGDEYTFTGNWKYDDGSIVTFPVSVKPQTGQEEIHINVSPVYDVEIIKHLTVERIDPIRNTHSSSSNKNKVSSYTHTFENPNDLGELNGYEFLGWNNDSETIQPGESKSWSMNEFENKENTITYTAQYQPAITVNWYVDDELIDTETSFSNINSNKECDVVGFKYWATEDGDKAEEVYHANGINENPKTVFLYANIEKGIEINCTPIPNDKKYGGVEIAPKNKEKEYVNKEIGKVIIPEKVNQRPLIISKTNTPPGDVPGIIENQKSTDKPETIFDISTPLSINDKDEVENWALINLILMILTALALLKLSDRRYSILSPILVICSIVLFILTENTLSEMILVDKYTIYMLIIYVLEVASRFLGKKMKIRL